MGAQATATRIGEQGLIREFERFFYPGGEDGSRVLAERRTSFLPPLADHAHMRACRQMQILPLGGASVASKAAYEAPLHCTSIGKALLAYQDARLVEEVIARGLPKAASKTITDPDVFRAELQKVRRQGYAFDDLEFHDDMRCVAVPIFEPAGVVRAGISLSGPRSRYTLAKLEELKDLTVVSARELAKRFGGVIGMR